MDAATFFARVSERMGWPASAWRLAVFDFWARLEGMPFERTWNPLATTRLSAATPLNLDYDIGYGPGNWNWVPVRVYASPEAGIAATVETLSLGYYGAIRRCFAEERVYGEAASEFATWAGSDAYGQRMVDFMASLPVAPAPAVSPEERLAVLEALVAGNGIEGPEGGVLAGEAALAYASTQGLSLALGLANTQRALGELSARLASHRHRCEVEE